MPAAATTFGRVISLRAVHEGRLNFVLFLRMYIFNGKNKNVRLDVKEKRAGEEKGEETFFGALSIGVSKRKSEDRATMKCSR